MSCVNEPNVRIYVVDKPKLTRIGFAFSICSEPLHLIFNLIHDMDPFQMKRILSISRLRFMLPLKVNIVAGDLYFYKNV
jgi:hypothetical protein